MTRYALARPRFDLLLSILNQLYSTLVSASPCCCELPSQLQQSTCIPCRVNIILISRHFELLSLCILYNPIRLINHYYFPTKPALSYSFMAQPGIEFWGKPQVRFHLFWTYFTSKTRRNVSKRFRRQKLPKSPKFRPENCRRTKPFSRKNQENSGLRNVRHL